MTMLCYNCSFNQSKIKTMGFSEDDQAMDFRFYKNALTSQTIFNKIQRGIVFLNARN